MVFRPSEEELAELLHEVDEDGSGEIEFGEWQSLIKMPEMLFDSVCIYSISTQRLFARIPRICVK